MSVMSHGTAKSSSVEEGAMERPLSSSESHLFHVIDGGIDADSSSMKDLGKTFRKSAWQDLVRIQLSSIADLNKGWDGYDADPISGDTVLFTFQILSDMWLPGLTVPDICPMSNDAIMVEWTHHNDCGLTLEIYGPYQINFSFEDIREDSLEEGKIAQNLVSIDKYLELFCNRSTKVQAVA